LRILNEDLAEANRAKDVFLATLSHELRTPLTPVVGWIKLLRNGTLDANGVAQALDAIERNAWLQSRLIDDLLDTSRIATGKLHYEPHPTDLNATVKAAIDTVVVSAASKNIDLTFRLAPTPTVVMGEPVRLQQIVWNLVSNAIKFTEPGGRVSVHVESDGSEARIIVEDSGIGIDPEFLPHVFDRFRQADGSTSRMHGGLGLGLAIAHALTKMHGGKLEVESEGKGHGARFILHLKLEKELVAPAEVSEPPVHRLYGLKVLIVEDSDDTLALLRTIFVQQGAQVSTATTATEALSLLQSNAPDIIVSDIGMPDTDGFDLLKKIREFPELENTPAIAISGYASESDRKQALGVGYSALMAKPVDVDALFDLIHSLKVPTETSSKN
jgi:CheY-like chemotaxis protein